MPEGASARFCCAMLGVALGSCAPPRWVARFAVPEEASSVGNAPFLKAHTQDGSVYVLEAWSVDADEQLIKGRGLLYDADRLVRDRGDFELKFDEVALLETNQPETVSHTGLIVMGVVTAASLAVTAVCLANPKTCFGSCPTFYADTGGPPLAEGFSESIARTLEATDIDALPRELGRGSKGPLSLWMKNEAPETHLVRSVRLLALPLSTAEEEVVRSGERFFRLRTAQMPVACRGARGDCGPELVAHGGQYLSATNPSDLGALETVELSFAPPSARGPWGVVVRARSSLVETFVFYQLMAYQGLHADDWLLALEKEGPAGQALVAGTMEALGRIHVQVYSRQGWMDAGDFREIGPIAWDEAVIEVPGELPEGPVRVRLSMAQGAWKLDRVRLAALGDEVAAERVEVESVSRLGKEDPVALAKLRNGGLLVTYPGDAYRLDFALPSGPHQLFLESRGYYYEWVRESWLSEESAPSLMRALARPDELLRHLAPAYKKIEPDIERLFWQSRVDAH